MLKSLDIIYIRSGGIFLKKMGLVPKLLVGIVLGILIGQFMPEEIVRLFVTLSSIFSEFLKFIVPLMILGFVVSGIADLTKGAGKLLGITTGISYLSTLIAGSLAYFVASTLFPSFIYTASLSNITSPASVHLDPYFTISIPPMLDVTSAIVFAFIMGVCISSMRGKGLGNTCYNLFSEFSEIIVKVLNSIIIPLLPLFVLGTFADMTYTGQTFEIVSILWKVFLTVIVLHLLYVSFMFVVAGLTSKKNPLKLIKNQIPGYLAALGTQSSAAAIPVNIGCAKENGVTREIREFVVPLCATIHLCGSMITITSCVTAVLMMFDMNHDISIIFPFILTLGIAMVAAPGAPGGAVMSALPFFPLVGISSEGAIASLLIALYITQDSFGTAANVSGDNAIAVIVDTIYNKYIKKAEDEQIEDI